jgi:hypothetical protein
LLAGFYLRTRELHAKQKKPRRKGRIRAWSKTRWVRLYESPFAELLTAVGTVVGSAIISISGGQGDRWVMIVVGAVIIAIGLLPTWARSTSINRGLRRDALLDARADVADVYVRRVLGEASELISMPRADRVVHAAAAIEEVVEDIWMRFYSRSDTVRVVYYSISDDETKLEPTITLGREGDARVFDSEVDVRGQLGLERLDIDDPFEYHDNVDDLPAEWGSAGRGYVSFLSIPVRVGGQGYGLISVDSSVAGELDSRDGDSLTVYASALGFFFASADRGKHGRNVGGGTDD